MLKTITTISFLLAVICITVSISYQEFSHGNYILYFGMGNALIFLLIMAVKSVKTTRALKAKTKNESTTN